MDETKYILLALYEDYLGETFYEKYYKTSGGSIVFYSVGKNNSFRGITKLRSLKWLIRRLSKRQSVKNHCTLVRYTIDPGEISKFLMVEELLK